MTKARVNADNASADIQGVTAGTGLSGGGTSGTVTITNDMATAIDAKGDLVVGTGADTYDNLAAGANATVLTADSSTATGLKWATPAGGGLKSFTLLNPGGTALTGAQTITVSGISNQQAIRIYIDSASSASASSRIYLRINGITSTNNYVFAAVRTTAAAIVNDGGNDYGISIGQTSSNAASVVIGSATIFGTASASGYMQVIYAGMGNAGGGTGQIGFIGQASFECVAALTSISVFSETGNFDGGDIYVYGMAV